MLPVTHTSLPEVTMGAPAPPLPQHSLSGDPSSLLSCSLAHPAWPPRTVDISMQHCPLGLSTWMSTRYQTIFTTFPSSPEPASPVVFPIPPGVAPVFFPGTKTFPSSWTRLSCPTLNPPGNPSSPPFKASLGSSQPPHFHLCHRIPATVTPPPNERPHGLPASTHDPFSPVSTPQLGGPVETQALLKALSGSHLTEWRPRPRPGLQGPISSGSHVHLCHSPLSTSHSPSPTLASQLLFSCSCSTPGPLHLLFLLPGPLFPGWPGVPSLPHFPELL